LPIFYTAMTHVALGWHRVGWHTSVTLVNHYVTMLVKEKNTSIVTLWLTNVTQLYVSPKCYPSWHIAQQTHDSWVTT